MKSNQRVKSLVEFVDIYPTLCELAGIKYPEHLQGKSMVTLLENPTEPFKEAIFGRYHGGDSVRTADFQYTEWPSGAKMLYSHTTDPDENLNIVGNPEQAGRVIKMQKLLQNHKRSL
jgi:arylsulfatase A-like enzyme